MSSYGHVVAAYFWSLLSRRTQRHPPSTCTVLYSPCIYTSRGMRHTSMAPYFCKVSKTCLHQLLAHFLINLFWENYLFNYCLQLLYLESPSKMNHIFQNNIFDIKIVLFQQFSLQQFLLVNIKYLIHKTSHINYIHIFIKTIILNF
jgi:hypothetical protein